MAIFTEEIIPVRVSGGILVRCAQSSRKVSYLHFLTSLREKDKFRL